MFLRVMTYNVRHGLGNAPAVPGGDPSYGVDLDRIARIILASDADVVAIQELDRNWSRSGCVDQPATLARILGMQVCFGANLRTPDGGGRSAEYGVAILSRHPILTWRNVPLPVADGWEPRGLLQARIAVQGLGEIAVHNTHLQIGFGDREGEGTAQRAEQARCIANAATAHDGPLVLMGDFNAEPGDEELSPLLASETGLRDAWGVAGDAAGGLTIPSHPEREPQKRIDLVFTSPHFHVQRCRVVDTPDTRLASDHFPVVADLELRSGARDGMTSLAGTPKVL